MLELWLSLLSFTLVGRRSEQVRGPWFRGTILPAYVGWLRLCEVILQGSLWHKWQTTWKKGQSQTVVKNPAIYKTAQRDKQFMASEVEKP